jgi:outer membrane protein with beta-barrel domain
MHKTIAVMIVALQFVVGGARVGAQTAQPASGARQSSDESGIVAGIKGGVSLARLSNEEEDGSRIGVIAGAWVARRLSGVIGLQLEGLYSAKGDRSFDNTVAIDYLEVPLLVMLKSAETQRLRPVFFTGPGVEFKLRTRYGDAPDTFQEGFNQFVHSREFEWVIGGGLDAPYGTRHVTLEARYTFGLTPVFDAEPTDSDSEKRNRVFSILVGYRFK